MAGGVIVVLGIGSDDAPVGGFTGTGMHGGKMFIRTDKELTGLPAQVMKEVATSSDLQEIEPYLAEYTNYFDIDATALIKDKFCLLRPNAKNPYKRLYFRACLKSGLRTA